MASQKCITCGLELMAENPSSQQNISVKMHKNCLNCFTCKEQLGDRKWCFIHKGIPYCDITCLRTGRRPKDSNCFECQGPLTGNSRVFKMRGRVYHTTCLRCAECGEKLKPGVSYGIKDDEIVCFVHTALKKRAPIIRTKISEIQRLSLMRHYKQCKYPSIAKQAQIAKKLKLPRVVVKVWFQNWRARCDNKLRNGLKRKARKGS